MSERRDQRPKATAVAPAPAPADVGIVAALPIEVAPLVDRMTAVRKYASRGQTIVEGQLDGKIVAVAYTGPGRARAQRGAQRLIDGHRPRWIVSAGFAGSLNPEIPRGALLAPLSVVNIEGRRFDADWPATLDASPFERRGVLLTTDEVVLKACEKATLRSTHGADLVDMETSAIVAYCVERSVRVLSLRVVSDDATHDLPPEILTIMGESGSYRIGAAIGAIWKRPSSLKDLLALREQAIEAASRLCDPLRKLLGRL